MFLCLLLILPLVRGDVFPADGEVVYDYRAVVRAVNDNPVRITSEYSIDAAVFIARFDGDLYATIDHVKYTVNVGNESSTMADIPDDAAALTLPFIVKRTSNNSIVGVLTLPDDKLWSIKMKQAIASLFQLDTTQLRHRKDPYVFFSDEHTVYGNCKIFYNVSPGDNSTVSIVKSFNPFACSNFNLRTTLSTTTNQCRNDGDKPLSANTDRSYVVTRRGDVDLIERIDATGSTVFSPFNGRTNDFTVTVDQTATLSSIRKSSPINQLNRQYHRIQQQYSLADEMGDITGERHTFDSTSNWENIRRIIGDMRRYMDGDRMTLSENIRDQHDEFNSVISLLQNDNELYSYYVKAQDDEIVFELFVGLLPYVGTHPSCRLIRNITVAGTVDEHKIIRMLTNMPFYLKYPNEELLDDMSALYTTKLSPSVHRAAVLSFASMISKVLSRYPNLNVRYVVDFIADFQTADYADKIVLIESLINIGTPDAVKFLIQVVRSNEDAHLTSLAVWGIKTDRFTLRTILWPLIYNPDLEIRAAVLKRLMRDPFSLQRLYRHFRSTDDELYRLFYTELEARSRSVIPCDKSEQSRARRMLRLIRRPIAGSRNFLYDYFDTKYGFAAGVSGSFISTDRFMSVYVGLTPQWKGLHLKQTAVYIRIGTSGRIPFEPSLRRLFTLLNNEAVEFELIKTINGKVTSVFHCKPGNCRKLAYDLYRNQYNGANTTYDVDEVLDGEIVVPTDIGVPCKFYARMPTLQKLISTVLVQFSKRGIDLSVKRDAKDWNQQSVGLAVYNPIVDAWHGSRKIHLVDARFPIDLTLNLDHRSLTAVIGHDEDVGFQTFTYPEVYITDADKKSIKTVCPKCTSNKIATKGRRYRNKYILMNEDIQYIKSQFIVKVFDCENTLTKDEFIRMKREFLNRANTNAGDGILPRLIMAVRHMWAFATISPMPGMCGFGVALNKINQIPGSRSTFKFNVKSDYIVDQTVKDAVTVSYQTTLNERPVQSWDAILLMEYVKNITNIIGNLKYDHRKVCVVGREMRKNYNSDMRLNLYTNDGYGDGCSYSEPQIRVSAFGKDVSIANKTLPKHYVYNIAYKPGYEWIWGKLSDGFRSEYSDYFVRGIPDELTNGNDVKIIFNYPNSHDVNVDVYSDDKYGFRGIPKDQIYWENSMQAYIGGFKSLLGYLNTLDACYMDVERAPTNWTLIASSLNPNHWEIYGKRDEHLSVRLILLGKTFEMKRSSGIMVTYDNTTEIYTRIGYYSKPGFEYKITKNAEDLYLNTELNLFVRYTGDSLFVRMPGYNYIGMCFFE